MKEVFLVRDDMQFDEFIVLSDDILLLESGKDFSVQVIDQEFGFYGDVEV